MNIEKFKEKVTNLNVNERKTLRSCLASARGNGYDFGFTDEIQIEGLNQKQIGGYLSQLIKKGFIWVHEEHMGLCQIDFADWQDLVYDAPEEIDVILSENL